MGSKTNRNGLKFESKTSLSEYYVEEHVRFKKDGPMFILGNKSKLKKYMIAKGEYSNVGDAHGCIQPDECYINEESKTIFIIEKKSQRVQGSACEKIQSADFKKWQYGRLYPNYSIVYIYCLSNWFKDNCKSELEYLAYKGVPVLFGDDADYKTKMIDLLHK